MLVFNIYIYLIIIIILSIYAIYTLSITIYYWNNISDDISNIYLSVIKATNIFICLTCVGYIKLIICHHNKCFTNNTNDPLILRTTVSEWWNIVLTYIIILICKATTYTLSFIMFLYYSIMSSSVKNPMQLNSILPFIITDTIVMIYIFIYVIFRCLKYTIDISLQQSIMSYSIIYIYQLAPASSKLDISKYIIPFYNGPQPTCSICLELIDNTKEHYRLPCSHSYHSNNCLGKNTVKDWFDTANTCPECRDIIV